MNKNPISFIAKNLYKYKDNLQKTIYTGLDTICAFSGERITEGIKKKDFISTTFTDYSYLKYESDYVGLDMALCMEYVIPNEKGVNISLRFKSFYCDENEMRFLKRDELENLVFNIPSIPFILCVSFGFKKHISFKSQVQLSNSVFTVFTDKGSTLIDLEAIKPLYRVMKNWYTIVKGKETSSQQPTYFTKDEIMFGTKNYNRIADYNGDFFTESKIIEPYRGTFLLEFLCHILNKRESK